jgi:transposase InsO family protein
VLDRHGLVSRVTRSRTPAQGTSLSDGLNPNDLWCADYKGEFQLGDKSYCYPLTVTDHASRFLLLCEALEPTREELAFPAFERLFRERGLPLAIRSDNGVPFASLTGCFSFPASPSGGCASASRSNAFDAAIPSRTAAMSACT